VSRPVPILSGVLAMASGPEHDIEQLNSLIEITLDRAEGYMDASDGANSRFSSLFRERGGQQYDIAQRLQARVKSLGGDPEESGTTRGAAERWFANLKEKMVGTDASIVAEVEARKDHVKDAYQKVITDGELSDPIRTAVESEFTQIQSNHDEMSKLKHGTD
jgi:uncharacterized protein (TIGR02284 family)